MCCFVKIGFLEKIFGVFSVRINNWTDHNIKLEIYINSNVKYKILMLAVYLV